MKEELYNFPIKFNDEEREEYKLWGLKDAKFLTINRFIFTPLAIFMIIYKYKIIFELYERNYWLYKFEILTLLGKLSPIFMIFSSALIIDIILLSICGLLIKLFDLIFRLFVKPVNQKHIEVTINPDAKNVVLKVLEKNKIIDQESINLDLLIGRLDLEDNAIKINNVSYIVGKNNRENIYLDMKPKAYYSEPAQYKNSITDIPHFKSVIDGLLNSLEEQKKERLGK